MPTPKKHKKFGLNALVWIRPVGGTDWKLLHFAKNYELSSGDADEIDITTHSSIGAQKESVMGLRAQGEFTADIQTYFNTSATTVTGESELNGLHNDLWNSAGTDDEYEFHYALPKETAITAHSATPATDRTYFTFNGKVKSFPVSSPHDAVQETTITFLVTSVPVLVDSAA